MKRRTRINYTPDQKTEMWDRWQRGESLKSIGRLFDRGSDSICDYDRSWDNGLALTFRTTQFRLAACFSNCTGLV